MWQPCMDSFFPCFFFPPHRKATPLPTLSLHPRLCRQSGPSDVTAVPGSPAPATGLQSYPVAHTPIELSSSPSTSQFLLTPHPPVPLFSSSPSSLLFPTLPLQPRLLPLPPAAGWGNNGAISTLLDPNCFQIRPGQRPALAIDTRLRGDKRKALRRAGGVVLWERHGRKVKSSQAVHLPLHPPFLLPLPPQPSLDSHFVLFFFS